MIKGLTTRKLAVTGMVLAMAASTLIGCTQSAPPKAAEPPKTSTEAPKPAPAVAKPLVVGIEADIRSLIPYNVTDGNSTGVQATMVEGLVRFDKDLKVVPSLASEWKVSEDAKSITFTLRTGVNFHDGAPFNAQAVKTALDFARNKDNKMARASFLSFISSIDIIDDKTVKISSDKPFSPMINYLAHSSCMIISPNEIKKKLDNKDYALDRNLVGTGPYKLAEWKDGQYIKVVPNDQYWNKANAAKVESITFKPVLEASTRVNMLKTGELDIVKNIPSLAAKELASSKDIDISQTNGMDVYYVGANMKLPQFSKEVRQAMNYAIDKNQLIAQVLNGYGKIAESAIAPNVTGFAKQKAYELNLEKAKELMKKAGYEKGFDTTLWTRNNTEFIAVAENVAIQLKQIGINAKVTPLEAGTLFDKLDAGKETEMYIGRWSPGTGDADYGLRPNFHSTRIPPTNNNSMYYINTTVDKLIDEAGVTADIKKANENYAQVQKIIYEDAAWTFLYVPDWIVGKRKDVSGIAVYPNGYIHVNEAVKK